MQWSLVLVTGMRGPPKGPAIARLLGVSSVRPGAGPMGPAGQARHSPLLYHLLLGNWATQCFLGILGSTQRAIQDSESQKCLTLICLGSHFKRPFRQEETPRLLSGVNQSNKCPQLGHLSTVSGNKTSDCFFRICLNLRPCFPLM